MAAAMRLQVGLFLGGGFLEHLPLLGIHASVRAQNFQSFMRASSKVTFSSLASLKLISRS
jgi:hypothetical protein